jgi:drug/metabolite transporter, DME family
VVLRLCLVPSCTLIRVSPYLRGVLLVLLAAGLWGTLGTLYTYGTDAFGLTPLAIVFWRAALAAIMLAIGLLVARPVLGGGWSRLRVRSADLPIFLAFGLLGVTAFYLLYIYAVVLVGVAVAVVLLYTAPVFVAVMSWRWLGEGFGAKKVAALLLTLAGSALVARAYDPALLQVNIVGILCGLGSAFTYALYSILGKLSLRRGYPISTMSFYVYLIGALGLLAVALVVPRAGVEGAPSGPALLVPPGMDASAWVLLGVIALLPTIGSLYAYTSGLRYLDAGVASILATFEPVVAILLAYFVVHEQIELMQLVGGGLVVAAVLLLASGGKSALQSVG